VRCAKSEVNCEDCKKRDRCPIYQSYIHLLIREEEWTFPAPPTITPYVESIWERKRYGWPT